MTPERELELRKRLARAELVEQRGRAEGARLERARAERGWLERARAEGARLERARLEEQRARWEKSARLEREREAAKYRRLERALKQRAQLEKSARLEERARFEERTARLERGRLEDRARANHARAEGARLERARLEAQRARWEEYERLKRAQSEEHVRSEEKHARSSHLLLAIAVRLLPPSERERYLEEFRAELLDIPRDTQFSHALSVLRGVFVLRLRHGPKNNATDNAVRRADG